MDRKEYVQVEGGGFLRAHDGVLFTHSNGAWIQFDGVPSVAMLTRVQHCLLRVEGVLRAIPLGIARTVHEALQAMRNSCIFSGGAQDWLPVIESAAVDCALPPENEGATDGPFIWPMQWLSCLHVSLLR